MTSIFFPCYSAKADKEYKKKNISQPLNLSPSRASVACHEGSRRPSWTVVLKAKHDFKASARPEISVQKGDYVRLLERPGNGWLKVQLIQEIGEGLVPAQYLEIAMNDPVMPISREWLNDVQVNTSSRNTLESIGVKGVYVSPSNNYWYRVDAVFSSGKTTVCAMFHEDFVSLQANISALKLSNEQKVLLPRKSYAVSPSMRGTPRGDMAATAQTEIINGLDTCLQVWLRLASNNSSNFLCDFLENHCTRKIYLRGGEMGSSNDAIALKLVEGSVSISLPIAKIRNRSFSPTAPLPPVCEESVLGGTHRVSPTKITSPLCPSTPTLASNLKYSSYLNQSRASIANCRQSMKSAVNASNVRPMSVATTASLNSLLDEYAFSITEDSDDESTSVPQELHHPVYLSKADPPKIESLHASQSSVSSKSEAKSPQLSNSTAATSTFAFNNNFESNYEIETVSFPYISDPSHEPRTPPLNHPHPYSFFKGLLQESPLQPKSNHTSFPIITDLKAFDLDFKKHHSSFPSISSTDPIIPLTGSQ